MNTISNEEGLQAADAVEASDDQLWIRKSTDLLPERKAPTGTRQRL